MFIKYNQKKNCLFKQFHWYINKWAYNSEELFAENMKEKSKTLFHSLQGHTHQECSLKSCDPGAQSLAETTRAALLCLKKPKLNTRCRNFPNSKNTSLSWPGFPTLMLSNPLLWLLANNSTTLFYATVSFKWWYHLSSLFKDNSSLKLTFLKKKKKKHKKISLRYKWIRREEAQINLLFPVLC